MAARSLRILVISSAFLAGLALCLGVILMLSGRLSAPVAQQVAAIGGPFKLIDQDGRALSGADRGPRCDRGGREGLSGLLQEGAARWGQLHHGSYRHCLSHGQGRPLRRPVQPQTRHRGGGGRSAPLSLRYYNTLEPPQCTCT